MNYEGCNMTPKQENIRDTYLWHINECERMFWVIDPRSEDGKKLKQATHNLRECLDVFCKSFDND